MVFHYRRGFSLVSKSRDVMSRNGHCPFYHEPMRSRDKKSLGRTGQFIVTASGILFFFIVYGYLQGSGSADKPVQVSKCLLGVLVSEESEEPL